MLELTANWSPTLGSGAGNVNWNVNTGGGFAARDAAVYIKSPTHLYAIGEK